MNSSSRAKSRNKATPRVALDARVLLQALLLSNSRAKGLRQAWQQGRYVPLIDGVGAQALMRALAYPQLQLGEEQQHELLADFLPYAQVVSQGEQADRADLLVSDCPSLRKNFSRRVSRIAKPHCRLLDSDEFFAFLCR